VAAIAGALAGAVGLDGAEARTLRRAGLLHDIGKLGVSSAILDKPGPLTSGEWAAVRRHPRLSMEILGQVPAFQTLAELAGAHHERLDGSGYWRGLRAEQLGRPARLLAVADVAEALSSERPYRPALGHDEVLAIMQAEAGTKLDPIAVEALADVLPAVAVSEPSWAPAPTPQREGA
jgi:HD-GYP domain-containing protein (c-di-GMP phosphodiesterase class II)